MSTNPNPFGGSALQAWQFHVTPLGGGADDTPNLRTAMTNAANYALNNQGYAEVLLDPVLYTLSSALSTASSGNAQLPIPIVSETAQGIILVMRTLYNNAANLAYFKSTTPMLTGAILQSTLTGQVYSGVNGAPSIIGGPTPEQGYGVQQGSGGSPPAKFNNVMIVIDGITLMPPLNPTVSGFHFPGMAKFNIGTASYLPNATPAQFSATQPTNATVTGLYCPQPLNNDNCEVGSFTSYGAFYGAILAEHANIKGLRTIYCANGAGVITSGFSTHGLNIGYFSPESCNNGLVEIVTTNPTVPIPVTIEQMDAEVMGKYAVGNHIVSSSPIGLGGRVNLVEASGTSGILVSSTPNMEIISGNQARGHVTSPTFVLGTPLLNPFWRHTFITITGGTVTGISIDGTATGLTSGTFMWPSGKTMTIAGSVLPTVTTWVT